MPTILVGKAADGLVMTTARIFLGEGTVEDYCDAGVLAASRLLPKSTKGEGAHASQIRMGAGSRAKHFPNGATDNYANFSGQIPLENGFFDLYVHSQGRGTSLSQLGRDGAVEVADLWAVEKTLLDSGWKPGQPIRLISCRAGDLGLGKQAAARQLNEFLQVKVKAPTQDIILFEDGSFVITNKKTVTPKTTSTGGWQEFE